MSTTAISHAELFVPGERYLRQDKGCVEVLPEPRIRGINREPDLLGFRRDGYTYQLDIKCSVSDLMADRQKPHRKPYDLGNERVYLFAKGVIEPFRIEDEWGWGGWEYDATSEQIAEPKPAPPWAERLIDRRAELAFLMQAYMNMRRDAQAGSAKEAKPSQGRTIPPEQIAKVEAHLEEIDVTTPGSAVPCKHGAAVLRPWKPKTGVGTKATWLGGQALSGQAGRIKARRQWGQTYIWLDKEGEGDE